MKTRSSKEAPLVVQTVEPAGEHGLRPAHLTLTNAVWVATALLHRRHPQRDGFIPGDIVRLSLELHLTGGSEASIWQHVRQHSVANKKPQPNTVCMLFDPGGGKRRLFRRGDQVYPGRNAERTHPRWDDLPPEYRQLRQWYEEQWEPAKRSAKDKSSAKEDPLLALTGTWKWETADLYVAKLRKGWDERP